MNQPPPGGMGGAPPPGGPVGYYTPPASTGARPGVILWFRVYAAASALLYVGFLFAWALMTPSGTQPHTSGEALAILLGFSLPILLVTCIGACIPYKPWGWTYALILIGLGMLGCLAPFSVVLIIFWSRPEVKAAFRRI